MDEAIVFIGKETEQYRSDGRFFFLEKPVHEKVAFSHAPVLKFILPCGTVYCTGSKVILPYGTVPVLNTDPGNGIHSLHRKVSAEPWGEHSAWHFSRNRHASEPQDFQYISR